MLWDGSIDNTGMKRKRVVSVMLKNHSFALRASFHEFILSREFANQ